ncbi:MAG: secretion system protein [Chloroflexaceae bacterium]|nr:secretion system protein [Chloroflexaceae bacterium]
METLLSSQILPFAAAGAILLVFVVVGAVIAMRSFGRDATSERLKTFTGGESADAGAASALSDIDAAVSKSKEGSRIAKQLAQADLKLRVVEFIGMKIAAAVLGAAIGGYIGRASTESLIISALVGAVVISFVPDIYLKQRISSRVKSFNAQLGDTITMMANSLRGGYSFLQTMDLVAREAPEPTASEFKRVVTEVALGRSTEDGLNNLLRRMPSEDLDLLITAVNIQHEVGGNLAQILDTIGHTIRERVRIKGEIKTLTAQGRLSGYVITFLPIGMGLYISAVNPTYMAPLLTFGLPPDAWCCMPVCAGMMIASGYYLIMRIVDIEV